MANQHQQMTEEQVKALQEKLKNMSPEELKEFQKQQCIFCQIIAGKVASKKIYEDNKCLAILDINPANPGHILLMPKEHYTIMPVIPENELSHLSMVAKALSHVILNSLKSEGTNIFIANGIAAGQRAQHFMIHIIPRRENDGLPFNIPAKDIGSQKLLGAKRSIKKKIESLFKIKKRIIDIEEKPKLIQETKFKDIEGCPEKTKDDKSNTKETKIKQTKTKDSGYGKKEKFVTSKTAKKYHRKNCSAAKKITKQTFLTEEEMKKAEKKPCSCINHSKDKSDCESEKKEKEVSLDDIANLFK